MDRVAANCPSGRHAEGKPLGEMTETFGIESGHLSVPMPEAKIVLL